MGWYKISSILSRALGGACRIRSGLVPWTVHPPPYTYSFFVGSRACESQPKSLWKQQSLHPYWLRVCHGEGISNKLRGVASPEKSLQLSINELGRETILVFALCTASTRRPVIFLGAGTCLLLDKSSATRTSFRSKLGIGRSTKEFAKHQLVLVIWGCHPAASMACRSQLTAASDLLVGGRVGTPELNSLQLIALWKVPLWLPQWLLSASSATHLT